jgi:hypothetical protein
MAFSPPKMAPHPLLIPELRFLNTFYHTLYGRILSVRCVSPFIARLPYSWNFNKNNEDFSIMFARQSKWGGCTDGERHIVKSYEEFYQCFCTGSVGQTILQHRCINIYLQYCIYSYLQNCCLSFISLLSEGICSLWNNILLPLKLFGFHGGFWNKRKGFEVYCRM